MAFLKIKDLVFCQSNWCLEIDTHIEKNQMIEEKELTGEVVIGEIRIGHKKSMKIKFLINRYERISYAKTKKNNKKN